MQRIEGVKTPESAYCLHPQQKQMATLRTPRLNIWKTILPHGAWATAT